LRNLIKSCVMLQREIPERINILVAQHAKKCGVDVLMDVGGDDGPLPTELTTCITLCAPNETELQNLTEMPTSTKVLETHNHNTCFTATRILTQLEEEQGRDSRGRH